jgi:hypothetical protein
LESEDVSWIPVVEDSEADVESLAEEIYRDFSAASTSTNSTIDSLHSELSLLIKT